MLENGNKSLYCFICSHCKQAFLLVQSSQADHVYYVRGRTKLFLKHNRNHKEIVSSQICLLTSYHQKMLFYCSLWQEKFQRTVTCAINSESVSQLVQSGVTATQKYTYWHQLSVWPQECKIRSAVQNEATVTEDPMTSLCMVRKCRVNRILLLVDSVWYWTLFQSSLADAQHPRNQNCTSISFLLLASVFLGVLLCLGTELWAAPPRGCPGVEPPAPPAHRAAPPDFLTRT